MNANRRERIRGSKNAPTVQTDIPFSEVQTCGHAHLQAMRQDKSPETLRFDFDESFKMPCPGNRKTTP